MTTPNLSSLEIKGIITSLNANFNYKTQPEHWEFPQQGQPPRTSMARPKMELDTEYVRLSFMVTSTTELAAEAINSSSGAIPMNREDIKRLNLTVGDTVTLRVSKE